jgi:hypothetical protein
LGTLTELNFQLSNDDIAETQLQLVGSSRPFGLVLTFDKSKEAPLQSTEPILVASLIIALLVALVLLFRKHQKPLMRPATQSRNVFAAKLIAVFCF